ncbi:MAG: OsmC family protein [Alphaproteobacteria bacterium]|jgi:uncharacterized OsmC-like protein|nr:OsmC family protein [Alphaproteobacteria bacterium]MBT4082207.1 OsmC family protein [Alphaproteobacteria bacterium]MBT4545002.1 OsmC family protein [Alphaproteobacteria bacterium]MBT7745785.1 OsmC family protein [Alphaproteobacteria bacterium]
MSAIASADYPNIVNGIDVDAVQALAQQVSDDPATGQTHWQVTSAWQGQTHSQSKVSAYSLGGEKIARDFTIDIDEPEELGGSNQFANPQEYLISALNACMIVGYTALCALNGIRIDKLEITTEGDIDLRGFLGLDADVSPGYDSLEYTVTIKGDASEEKFREIHEMVTATSPNFHNISTPVALQPTFIVE